MNDDLCQECQERKHNNIMTFDVVTGNDLDWPVFVCDICYRVRMIQNGWSQDQGTGNFVKSNLTKKTMNDVCIMCRAAMHSHCENQDCDCEDC